jgi:signal transduction histidine kinase/ActR/RegA family two-component response regulator
MFPRPFEALRLGKTEEVPFRRIVFESGLVLALLPLLFLIVVTSHERMTGLAIELNKRLFALSRSYSLVAEAWLGEKESKLESIAEDAAELQEPAAPDRNAAMGRLERKLAELRVAEPGVLAFGALAPGGRVLASSVDPSASAFGLPGADPSLNEAYRRAAAPGESAYEAVADRRGGSLLLIVFPFGAGAAKGAAYCVVGPEPLARLLAGLAAPYEVEARILDSADRLVASSVDPSPRFLRYSIPGAYHPLIEGEMPRIEGAMRDIEKSGFYLEADSGFGPGWRVLFSVPIAPFRNSVVSTGLAIALFSLGIVLVVLVASLFASIAIVSSLEELRRAADRFSERAGKGEAISWPTSHMAEIADLSRTLAEADALVYSRHWETLAALADAKKANAEKERLLTAVSHDIRSPLGGMVDMAGVLAGESGIGEGREQARLIAETGRELLDLVEALLDRSAIEAGRFQLREAPFDLRLLLDAVARAYAPAAKVKALKLDFVRSETLPRRVVGDRARLFQVFGNLVGNAVKYTEHGSILVSAELQGEEEERATLRFEIADTGPGIPPEKLSRIFEPFFRVNDSAHTEIEGRGLGLAIADFIVTHMGGKISVESEPDKGTRFGFTLGLALAAPETGPETGPERSSSASRAGSAAGRSAFARILLADDQRINRAVARRVLEEGGHLVEEVEDGRAAVDAALRADYDLAFLDIGMPRLDGRAAAGEIIARFSSERPGDRRPMLVALTASTVEERSLLDAGFDGYIAKPALPKRLLDAARSALERGPARTLPQPPLVDIEGLLSAYGGSHDFLRRILEVFVADGGRVVATLSEARTSGFSEASGGNFMAALHSLVNIMGAGMAESALVLARECETAFRGADRAATGGIAADSAEELAASGLESALVEAERAIASARMFLESEKRSPA